MSQQPVLSIVQLSESFHALWDDIAEELAVRPVILEPATPPVADSVAVVVAAGGEEDRGLDVLLSLEGRVDGPAVYLVGTRTSHRFGVEALRRGATDYFALPGDLDLLRRTLRAKLDTVREERAGSVRGGDGAFDTILGDSPALRAALDRAIRILPHRDVTVLVGGETGTGKELLARAIHDGGPRAKEPFVAVNCAAIPASLLESELFGHEKGAFTDAHQAKLGLFEEADGGTLFLDEIGHLPLQLQGKLLRALDERRIRRVGSNETRGIDVRIVAATHVDLEAAVARGEFREDLYYRLKVVPLFLPPLRDRGSDLELLAGKFVESLAKRYGLRVPIITRDVLVTLRAHRWPGNVRELRHAIERALLLSPPGTIDPAELGTGEGGATPVGGAGKTGAIPFPATMHEIASAAATEAVRVHDGNKSAAARQLGISRARLQRLLDSEGEDGGEGTDE